MGLQISCDFILLECQNASNGVPKKRVSNQSHTDLDTSRGCYFYNSGEGNRVMIGREAEAGLRKEVGV